MALSAAGYRLTRTLAAAPQLVAPLGECPGRGPVRVGGADRWKRALYRFRTQCRASGSLAEKLLKHGG